MLNLQPHLVINSRLPGVGDYVTPEQYVPLRAPSGWWETCMTMNKQWSYHPDPAEYKSSRRLLRILAEVAGKGGNLLLNVGPKPDGTFPDEAVERLKTIGGWMENIEQWEANRFSGNPILEGSEDYDSKGVLNSFLYKEGSTYYLFYVGQSSSTPSSWTICLAYSSDLVNWTKLGRILEVSESGWDSKSTDCPFLLKNDTTYFLFYTGTSKKDSDGTPMFPNQIGVATSSNISGPYTKYEGNPIINVGPSGSWDDSQVAAACVIWNGPQWMMFYSGAKAVPPSWKIGVAYSDDLFAWSKYDGNPISSTVLDSDETSKVFISDNDYYMITTKISNVWANGIYLYKSTSPDLLSWKFVKELLSASEGANWDSYQTSEGNILFEEDTDKLFLFYDGGTSKTYYGRKIGYAVIESMLS